MGMLGRAAEAQAAELGISLDRRLTETGGMAFGGGPFNNYVLQSTVAVARCLRQSTGARGLVTTVSGLLTKPGLSVWSIGDNGAPGLLQTSPVAVAVIVVVVVAVVVILATRRRRRT